MANATIDTTIDASILDSPATDAPSSAATDEMLSQLAGNEIDHLLLEAEAGRTTPPPPPAPIVVNRANDVPPGELDELLVGLVDPAAPVEAAPVANPPVAPPPAPEAAAAPVAINPEITEEERITRLAAELEVEPTGSAATAELDEKESHSAPPPPPAAIPISTPIPLFLRPLIWINSPFAACPTRVRNLLGNAAILTSLNAAAILVYVVIFKKHSR